MRNTLPFVFLLSTPLWAQDLRPTQQQLEAARNSSIDANAGLGLVSGYYFRGIVQERRGLIAQPWIELSIDALDAEDSVRDLRLYAGQWNSLDTGTSGTKGGGSAWYESRFYTGAEFQFGERLHLDTRYTAYSSPNGLARPLIAGSPTWSTVQEVSLRGRFDDRGIWFDALESGLQPSVFVAFEVDGQRDGGNNSGVYCELGIEPSFVVGRTDNTDITLRLPVKLGLSLTDYYERSAGTTAATRGGNDEPFGFLQFGGVVSSPLSFLPEGAGPWQAEVGLSVLLLGDNNKDRNNGDAAALVFGVSIGTFF